ncbi:putative nucleoporin nup49 protein [Zalerion maritima]|uniref:Nucleoporin nup49 protein n=1 Tax=Zalerion maritima TaxID=339359 RepID=A0AAD5RYU2_9PEZI|nr:putative nucleoporin nup49 protein [Zalerion maritima]
MFGRSASGPSGLTINTGAANTFGGSSNSSQPPAGGGLFGSSNTQPSQPVQSNGLFGSVKPATSGLFGSSAATTTASSTTNTTATQPQQGSGLFGSTAATSQPQQQQSSGIFGSSTATAKPATGGLFGASTINQDNQQQHQAGGLFGASTMNQPARSTGGGLFGAASAQQPQQQQPQAGGSLFGNNPAQAAGGGGGLFGQSTTQNTMQQQQQQRPGGAFGLSSQPQQHQPSLGLGSSTNAGLTMGQTNTQTVPGVRIDVSNLRGTTRFNDLQEDLQKQIQMIDLGIQRAQSEKNELDAFMPAHGEQIDAIPNDVKFVARKYAGVDSALAGDANAISVVRGMVNEDAENAKLSFRAVDNLKLPSAYHTQGLWRSGNMAGAGGEADAESQQDLVGFFSRAAGEMDDQLQRYTRNLAEIETHMSGVNAGLVEQIQKIMANKSNGGGINSTEDRLAELAAVLREFEESILQVAGKVGTAREGVTHLQLGDFMGRSKGLSG